MRTTYIPASLLFSLILFAGCAGSRAPAVSSYQDDPDVVAVIDGRPITLSEFERRYAKAVGGADQARGDSLAAYQDFLSRYVDFRLKVLAGVEAGLPDDPALSQEIEQYRRNFARPYLLEQEVLEPLIREVYDRQQEMVKARHILIRVDETAAPADTLAAYNRLASVVDSIEASADFGEMAFRHSEDPSAQRESGMPGARGDLGFFSAGQMVEPFETFAYTTDVGEMSPVFRTRFGYHVLQVQERVPTPPAIRIAHIMIDPTQYQGDAESPEAFAQELAERIQSGEDFAQLAREHSHDINSAPRGGEIGVIQYGTRIVEPFKQAAFALANPGDVSGVVETMYGYHIIKLLERQTPPTYEEAYDDLKQRVARMPRAQESERALAMRIRSDLGATVDTTALLGSVSHHAPGDLVALIRADSLAPEVMQRRVAALGEEAIVFADVAAEAAAARGPQPSDTEAMLLAAVEQVLNDRAIDAGARMLETRDQEFGDLMQEFRDGLILFRFMEDSVWTAAAQDTLALKEIYDANPSQYRFGDRTRIISVSASRDSTIQEFLSAYDASPADAFSAVDGLRIDTTYVTGATNSRFDEALALPEGARTDAARQAGRFVVLINDGVDPARQKTFEEARPELVTVYQDQLEQQILDQLRRRYAVQTYPDRLRSAFDSGAVTYLPASD